MPYSLYKYDQLCVWFIHKHLSPADSESQLNRTKWLCGYILTVDILNLPKALAGCMSTSI